MMELSFVAVNATTKQLQREVSLNTKEQYMKESNTLVGNVTIKHPQRGILHDTKGQYMSESKSKIKIDLKLWEDSFTFLQRISVDILYILGMTK